MTLRTSRLLLTVAIFVVCGLAVAKDAVAQAIPKETEREKKSASVRRERRQIARKTAPTTSKTNNSEESDHFLDLGDGFKDQQKWKAAEAAYKEAVNVWSGNAEAVQELGYLYLTIGKIVDAQQTCNRLRSVNGPYASELQGDINVRKSARDH